MSESSAGGVASSPSAAAAAAAAATGATGATGAASVPSSSGTRAPAAPSQSVRSPPGSLPSSTFPTYASSSRHGAASASAAAYFAPPNPSFLASDTAAAAAASSSSSASSASSSSPSAFTSPHPFAASTSVLAPSSSSSAASSHPASTAGSSSASPHAAGRPLSSSNAIVVSPRQRGNPVLAHIRNCPWEFAPPPAATTPPGPPFLADYLLGPTTCALYLSLRYHLLHPLYLLSRMQPLRAHYTLRLLLLHVDVDDSEPPLTDVTAACFTNGWTLLLGWSADEVGRWLELFKVMASKGREALEGAGQDAGDEERLRDVLGVVKGVNKTDTAVLLSTFGSVTALARASEAELLACVGVGAKKVKRLRLAFNQPFVSSQAVHTLVGGTGSTPSKAAAGAAAEAVDEKKEAGGSAAAKRASEASNKERAASASQTSLFAPPKKQKTGAIVRLDN